MNWIYTNNFIYSINTSSKNKIASFDIDWTIIKPKSGYKFPKK